MKKITYKNIIWLFIIFIILFEIYSYFDEYVIIKNYQYGEKYNVFRQKNRIPIIDSEMEPFKMPVDNYWGMIWINENNTEKEKPLVHRIKIIDASKEGGWINESDNYLYFINDTTEYILKIESKKSIDKINFEYKLVKTDSRKKDFENYQVKEYKIYSEKKLNESEFDSIKNKWKLE